MSLVHAAKQSFFVAMHVAKNVDMIFFLAKGTWGMSSLYMVSLSLKVEIMVVQHAAASSFAVGIAAWPWGLLSDRIGRKAIILFGNCSTATCIVLFSLSGHYWAALLFRFLAGVLDGSLV